MPDETKNVQYAQDAAQKALSVYHELLEYLRLLPITQDQRVRIYNYIERLNSYHSIQIEELQEAIDIQYDRDPPPIEH